MKKTFETILTGGISMKKTFKTIAAHLILTVFCMALAAGCGKNPQKIKENTQETQTQEAVETESAVQIGNGTTVAPTPVPPGTDPDPETVPKADQTDVGKTAVLKLGDEEPVFCYTYNSQTSQERLTVMSDSDPDNGTARITVYSVKLGGISGLAEAIGQELHRDQNQKQQIGHMYKTFLETHHSTTSSPILLAISP